MYEFIKQAPTVGIQFHYNSAVGEWNCYIPAFKPRHKGTANERERERVAVGLGFLHLQIWKARPYPGSSFKYHSGRELFDLLGGNWGRRRRVISALSLYGPLALYLRDFPLQESQPQSGLPTNLSYPSSTYCTCQITSWPSLVTKSRCAAEGFKQIACGASK